MSVETIRKTPESYYPVFEQNIIEDVNELVERLKGFETYGQFFDSVGAGEPEVYLSDGYSPQSVVDIRPKDHDEKTAIFVDLAMANPNDPNQRFLGAGIAALNPDRRVVMFGELSSGRYGKTGRLALRDSLSVMRSKNLKALAAPRHSFAKSEGIEVVSEAGYSGGALTTILATELDDYEIDKAVVLDPVLGKRSTFKLGLDFASTAKELKTYVEATDLPIFNEARSDSLTGMQYNRGLIKLTNLAKARALARCSFENRAYNALMKHPGLLLSMAYATESELATDAINVSARLLTAFPGQFEETPLHGDKHAVGNNIPVHLAVIQKGLSMVLKPALTGRPANYLDHS